MKFHKRFFTMRTHLAKINKTSHRISSCRTKEFFYQNLTEKGFTQFPFGNLSLPLYWYILQSTTAFLYYQDVTIFVTGFQLDFCNLSDVPPIPKSCCHRVPQVEPFILKKIFLTNQKTIAIIPLVKNVKRKKIRFTQETDPSSFGKWGRTDSRVNSRCGV